MRPKMSFPIVPFLSVISLFTWSCNSEEEGPNPSQQGQMTAIVDGQNWEASTVSAGTAQGKFSLSGASADGATLSFSLESFEQGGYASFPGAPNAFIYQPAPGALGYTSIAPMGFGQLLIEEINEQDSLISGTFLFRGVEPSSQDTVLVEAGVFTDVPYQLETVAIGDNFLRAKVDGTLWEAGTVAGIDTGDKLQLVGSSPDGSRAISLMVSEDIDVGTYAITDIFSDGPGAMYNPNSQTSLSSSSGTLDISTHDKLNKIIEGTFSFEASEWLGSASASITEGSFYVQY